uniref:Uncharacterized protein n=1 Tax=Arcella intermedia TaxID=1963864 RepID=A0A6B2L6N1_9EUKA
MVTNNTTLKCLILKSNALGDDGAFGIAVDLSVNTSLTSLSLAFNNIHHEGIANIVEALKVNTTLRNLNISGNKFGVDGAYQIASLLENNSTLKKLNLSASDLNDVGLHKILQSLEKNTTLKELKLQNLDNDINNSVEYLVFLLKTKCHLTKLNLRFNLFTPQNLSLLIETLRHSTTLTSVDLSGQNKFTLEKAEEIESVIQTNSTLTSLSLNDNNIDDAICQPIIRGLCCNTSLRELHLSGNQVYDIQGLLGHLHKNSTLTLLNLKDNKKFNRDDNNLVCSFMAINKTLSHDLGLIAKWPRSHESLDIVEQKEIEELLHVLRIYLPIDLQVQSITLLLKIKKYKKYKKAKKNVITNALY